MTARTLRWLRIGRRCVLAVAVVITVLCAGLLLAAIRNDQAITGNLGTATAEVDAVTWDRTIIRFETPDGVVHSPNNGVLYPSGLVAGDLVRIEYDAADPDLARVAGRTATLTLLPLGSTVLITWLVAVAVSWVIGQRLRRTAPRTPEAVADDAPVTSG
ncbi:hypothetical protein HNR02_001301 [Amycolatopsis endophytica]|uniref:DUF3592 domain-containing protein n=1 Tax=Amycolatopsis endophytica TaxID=860233 RepID=A0A853AZ04_9PSEU|nr:hypothetical protein [Amycolatopsis endophytica]